MKDENNKLLRSFLKNAKIYSSFQKMLPRESKSDFASKELAFKAGSKVLDIGCGPADILQYLDPSIQYYGLDPNKNYIEHARNTFGDRGSFFCSGIEGFELDQHVGSFDYVMALGVLHHLNDSSASELIIFSNKMLKPEGQFLTVDPGRVHKQNPIARLLVNMDRGMHVRFPEAYVSLIKQAYKEVDFRITHDRMRVPYTHFLMRTQKIENDHSI